MTAEQQKTIGLQSVRVGRQPITEPVRGPGIIAFDQGKVAILRPLNQSRVIRLLAQPGDMVRAGEPLAELDMPNLSDEQASLATARASMREADAGIAVAREALRRGEILARDGSLSHAEAEQRRLVLAQATAASESARARVAALQAQINRLNPGGRPGVARLASPIAGVVVSVNASSGGAR